MVEPALKAAVPLLGTLPPHVEEPVLLKKGP